jgi:competence protein ComEC
VARSRRLRIALPPPIVLVLAAFAAGVVALKGCGDLPPHPLALAFAGAVAVASGARIAARAVEARPGARAAVLLLAASGAALCGFGYAAWRSQLRIADELPSRWEGEDVEVRGVVDELPRAAIGGVRFAFAVERIETPGAVVPSRISVAWYAAPRAFGTDESEGEPPPAPIVRAGERWQLTVRLSRPHGSVNPAGFDLEGWLFANNLRATGYVRTDGRNVRVDAFAGRPGDFVERARERVRDRIAGALPGARYGGVLAALTVGDQRAIPDAQWTVFNRTGISHLVSISGTHVTVFALIAGGIALAVLRRATWLTARCAAKRIAVLVGLAASSGYVALAGAEVPALRTLAMLAIGAIGLWLDRPGTGRIVWLWALAAVLVLDPWAPHAPGFWLSFGAVAILIYGLGARLSDAPAGRVARAVHALRMAARTQWTVTVGLVPFTLALFGQFSLVSPLANALAIPWVTFVVVPVALLAAALPFDSLWTLAHAAVTALMAAMEPLAALPAAAWMQHAPTPWTVVVGTAAVVLLLAPRGVPGRGLGVIGVLPLVLVTPPAPKPGEATVTVLDVGQGLAVVVQTATHALVYDTGPRYSPGADAGGRIVAPFLRAAGMPRLSALVVSHADTDHSGGAMSLLDTVPVDWIASSLPLDHPVVRRGAAPGGAWRCEAGQRWQWDGVRFAVLHPSADAYAEASRKTNDLSCVLRVDARHGSVLLTGDVEARSERELLARDRSALAADVLLMPHHGSRTSSTPAFVTAVAPRIAVITAGYRNRFGHPRGDVVERYASRGVATARTDLDGAVTIALDERGIVVERMREAMRRYWQARAPP